MQNNNKRQNHGKWQKALFIYFIYIFVCLFIHMFIYLSIYLLEKLRYRETSVQLIFFWRLRIKPCQLFNPRGRKQNVTFSMSVDKLHCWFTTSDLNEYILFHCRTKSKHCLFDWDVPNDYVTFPQYEVSMKQLVFMQNNRPLLKLAVTDPENTLLRGQTVLL